MRRKRFGKRLSELRRWIRSKTHQTGEPLERWQLPRQGPCKRKGTTQAGRPGRSCSVRGRNQNHTRSQAL